MSIVVDETERHEGAQKISNKLVDLNNLINNKFLILTFIITGLQFALPPYDVLF